MCVVEVCVVYMHVVFVCDIARGMLRLTVKPDPGGFTGGGRYKSTTSGHEKISNGHYSKTAERPTISEVTIGFYVENWV